jgi:hypothetical protein
MPLKKEFVDSLGIKRVHLVVGGRLVKKLHVGYDKNDLPILDYTAKKAQGIWVFRGRVTIHRR